MKLESSMAGVFPSLPTIFDQSGELDEEGQRNVVRLCLEKKVHGLTCLLIGGEFYKLSDSERKRVAEIVIDECSINVPVFVGTAHSGATACIELSRHAKNAGADGVVVAAPYFSHFLQEAESSILGHFEELGAKIELPVMIQDYEAPGGLHICASDLLAIACKMNTFTTVKIEGTGHLKRIADFQKVSDHRVPIFGGMVGRYLIEEQNLGLAGTIPGAALPEKYVQIYNEYKNAGEKSASSLHKKLLPYLNFLMLNFLSFVGTEKEVLKMRGVIRSSKVRAPAVPLGDGQLGELRELIQKEVNVW